MTNSLRECFEQHDGRALGKIDHFFDVYEPHFARFRGTQVRVLEIGVDQGGSLTLWRSYFGPQARVHGIDIDPKTADAAPAGTRVHIGSQADVAFLRSVARSHGPFDIVIDDGSHLMQHQLVSFETLYPLLSDRGIYVCEDAFTSYWKEFGGGINAEHTFIEYAKSLVDELHAYWAFDEGVVPSDFTRSTRAIHFYSGTVVFERQPVSEPVYAVKGVGAVQRHSIAKLKAAAARNMRSTQK